jgi:ascorbate-specific PTS system EIIC-type component UlaA
MIWLIGAAVSFGYWQNNVTAGFLYSVLVGFL